MAEFNFTILDEGIPAAELANIMMCCFEVFFPGA